MVKPLQDLEKLPMEPLLRSPGLRSFGLTVLSKSDSTLNILIIYILS